MASTWPLGASDGAATARTCCAAWGRGCEGQPIRRRCSLDRHRQPRSYSCLKNLSAPRVQLRMCTEDPTNRRKHSVLDELSLQERALTEKELVPIAAAVNLERSTMTLLQHPAHSVLPVLGNDTQTANGLTMDPSMKAVFSLNCSLKLLWPVPQTGVERATGRHINRPNLNNPRITLRQLLDRVPSHWPQFYLKPFWNISGTCQKNRKVPHKYRSKKEESLLTPLYSPNPFLVIPPRSHNVF